MADTDTVEKSLGPIWRITGHRIAAAAGAGMGLACLIQQLPVQVAAMRGAMVLIAVLFVTGLTGFVVQKFEDERMERDARSKEART